jgi:hypothetical protein
METTLVDLTRRVTAFINAGERAEVLDQPALAAFRLMGEYGAAPDNDDGLAALCVAAMFLWCRAQAGGQDDLDDVSRLLMLRLHDLAASGAVPVPLRPLTDAVLRDMMLDARARHGLRSLDYGIDEDDGAALDAGIETVRLVLAESGERLAIRNDCQARLSLGLWRRFQHTGNLEDLDEAIGIGTDVVDSHADRNRALFAAMLASMLVQRYGVTGDQADLKVVISLCQGDGERLGPADETGADLLAMVRDARLALFEASGDAAELDKVVSLGWVLIGGVKGEQRGRLFAAQADVLTARFGQRGSTSDRDDAIRARRMAADEFGGGAEWLMTMLELRDQLMGRWLADQRPASLDELLAVDTAVLPELEDDERVMLLRSQIRQLWDRLNRNGPQADLDLIIKAAQEVCRLNDPPAGGDLSDLCYFLQLRYPQTREAADLHGAVAAGRKSARYLAAAPEAAARQLSNLFGAIAWLADETGSPGAWTEAVEVAERTVSLFPEGAPARASHLANLTTALWGRFQAEGNREDLYRSISCGQRALDAIRPDDPRFSELGASVFVALTLRFREFDDDTALEQALAVLRRDTGLSHVWMEGLNGLIESLTRRIERESEAGRDEPAALVKYQQIRDGLLRLCEEGLMLMSTQVMEAGGRMLSPDLIDSALGGLRQATELGGEPRRNFYRGLRAEYLIRRWEVTKGRADIDTAIRLLVDAAADPSETDHNRGLLGQHAARALVRRFRHRRRAEDLRAARNQLEQAMMLMPASEMELHEEMRGLRRYIDAFTAKPPFLVVLGHVDEADREDLSSPHGNLSAFNEGSPRFSGLTWVHTREDGAGVAIKPGGELMRGRRVLFLRTFMEDDSNFVILNSLALSLHNDDRLELVGDSSDRPLIEKHWQVAFGPGARPENRVDFIASTDTNWRRDVLARIQSVDAIILFISPKDADFPEFPFPPASAKIGAASDWERFIDTPMTQPLTGPGLLREICYLNRLQRLPDTVVVCDSKYQAALDDLIALGGMMGAPTDLAGNPVTPRLTVTDMQVGYLRKASRGITYRRPENSVIMPNLAQAIRQALDEIHAREHPRYPAPWAPQDLCGTSPHPRRLPPDNKRKVITFTDAESVFFIPAGEITEVSRDEILKMLSREAVRAGCPFCRAPIEQLFFYAQGLERQGRDSPGEQHAQLNARCQVCGHKSSLREDTLLAM